jgi:amino acid adenylation domain-containing protein
MQRSKEEAMIENKSIMPYTLPAISHGDALLQQPAMSTTLPGILIQASDASPAHGITYILPDCSSLYQSYPQLLQQATQLLGTLQQRGLRPKDKAILQFNRNEDFLPAFWACLLGGMIPVLLPDALSSNQPSNVARKVEDTYHFLEQASILTISHLARQERVAHLLPTVQLHKIIFTDHPQEYTSSPLIHQSDPDDLALLALTSGSTGNAKLVMLTHHNLISQMRGVAQLKQLSSRDISLNWLPLDHVGSICTHIRDIDNNILQLQMAPDTILQDPLLWLKLMATYHVTLTRAPNFAFKLMNDQASHLKHQQLDLSSLRFIINAGEAIVPKVARQFLELFGPYGLSPLAMHPCWGMTETSSGVTYSTTFALEKIHDDYAFVELGGPLPGVSLRIVDDDNTLVSENTIGRLQVRGTPLTAGYYQNAQANQHTFTPDGWFDTGDLGMLKQGRLTVTGRAKDHIIINGVNYYSHEIEAVIEEINGVLSSYVAACAVHDTPGSASDKLAIILSVADSLADQVLSDLLRAIRLTVASKIGITPHYIVPVPREAIPKTSTGKVQRRLLAQRFAQGEFGELIAQHQRPSRRRVQPRDLQEEQLLSLWQELFGLAEIDLDDDYFALGGDSLLAIRFLAGLRAITQAEISAYALFTHSTFAEMLAHIKEVKQASPTLQLPAVTITPRQNPLPLSFAQQRLWFQQQLMPNSSFYHISAALLIEGSLKLPALERALEALIYRHEALRTTIHHTNDTLLQTILPSMPFSLPVIDLPVSIDQMQVLQSHITTVVERPLALTTHPPIRLTLLRLHAQQHVFVVTMHHIISDGWSMGIFWRELSHLYTAFARNETPAALPALSLHYADFAIWQQQIIQQGYLQSQLDYWKRQLGDATVPLELATDFPRPSTLTYRGQMQSLTISSSCTQQLEALGHREHSTLFMILLAAFHLFLYRYTDQDDIVIGTPAANRGRSEFYNSIGSFTNPLAIRAHLSGNPSFLTLLTQIRETVLAAYDHQDLPFELVVEALQPERSSNRPPLFQVMFAFQDTHSADLHFDSLATSFLPVETRTAKLDLTLFVSRSEQGLLASLEYCTDLFEADTITRMLHHYQHLLDAIVEQPEQGIAYLPLLSSTEQHQLLYQWNATQTPYPRTACIHHLFEAQVARNPDRIALVNGDEYITYQQLNQRANQLARYLQLLQVESDTFVGVYMERSPVLIVALLAILKAGAAYVPFDLSQPLQRLLFMFEDTHISVLLTQQRLCSALPTLALTRVVADVPCAQLDAMPTTDLPGSTHADNLAYAMYTSGSTGLPKAVCIEHRSVVRLVQETNYITISHDDVFMLLAPVSFDASTLEIWGALLNGGSLVIPPPMPLSLEEIGRLLQDYRVTLLWLTAGLFHQMVDEQLSSLRSLRQLLAGGDVLSPQHVERLMAEIPTCTLINGYGPTENTTFTCTYRANDHSRWRHSVPIGKPIANTRAYILDRHLQPVPIGVVGNLYAGGDGLARGYLNRPELTAEKFIPDPFSVDPAARLYATGDRARYLPDGTIEFFGRNDQQIKIRGFRIEPGEIEYVISTHPDIREIAVLVREDRPGEKYLVAYIVPWKEAPAISDLRELVDSRLPSYMHPSFYISLPSLPLGSNGKLDRHALPVPHRVRDDMQQPPRTPVEEVVHSLWMDLLGVDALSIHDNFFLMGGHSLIATRLIARLNRTFQTELPLRSLFNAPTVAGMSAALLENERTPGRCEKIALLRKRLDAMSDADIHTLLQTRKTRGEKHV